MSRRVRTVDTVDRDGDDVGRIARMLLVEMLPDAVLVLDVEAGLLRVREPGDRPRTPIVLHLLGKLHAQSSQFLP